MTMTLFGEDGRRKYLTRNERELFLSAAARVGGQTYTLCWVILSTGCRISEALSLTVGSVDHEAQMIVIECLKKRKRGVFRAVPAPADLLAALREVHSSGRENVDRTSRLWPWCRMTAYRNIRKVMTEAGLRGAHAMPKGLRHGFGVAAIQCDVPLNLVQRWLGHADMRTTAIYANAMGAEERSLAAKMWRNPERSGPRNARNSRQFHGKGQSVKTAHLPDATLLVIL